jgi:hypothetical protein
MGTHWKLKGNIVGTHWEPGKKAKHLQLSFLSFPEGEQFDCFITNLFQTWGELPNIQA